MPKIDLHMHTNISDGELSPKELVDLAIQNNESAIAITDHDKVDGIEDALNYTKNKNIEIIPGIEFTVDPEDLAKEIHIIGLFIDHKNKEIKEIIDKHQNYGIIKIKKIIQKLNDLNYAVSFEELEKTGHFNRPTLAKLLMKKYPEFKDRKQVFSELLGAKSKCFIKSETTPMKEIISVIHNARGIAILAHPGYLKDNAEKVITKFIEFNGDAIEVDCHYEYFGEDASKLRDKFRKIAQDNNLLISGGTDFHYPEKSTIADFGVSLEEFRKLKEAVKNKVLNSYINNK